MANHLRQNILDNTNEKACVILFFSKNNHFQSLPQKQFYSKSNKNLLAKYYYANSLAELFTLLELKNPNTILNIATDGYSFTELSQITHTLSNKEALHTYTILWIPNESASNSSNEVFKLKVNDFRYLDQLESSFELVIQLSLQHLYNNSELDSFNEKVDSEVKVRTNKLFQFNKKLKETLYINNSENKQLNQHQIEIEKQKQEIEKRNAELEKSFKESSINHIKLQKLLVEIQQKNHELQTKNEEITTQRDFIEQQNEEIQVQRDVALLQQEEIRDNLLYASRIQQALFPPTYLINQLLPNHFILNLPKDIVSGDFYWISQNRFKTVIAVADCTGHGISGAMMSMLGTAFLNEIINKNDITNSSQILGQLRDRIIASLHQELSNNIEYSRDGLDIAVCIIDILDNTLEYSGANNPLYLIRQGELIEMSPDKMPIGIHDFCSETFKIQKIDIKSGDSIYMFSDGYPDQFGGLYGKKLKYTRFKQLLIDLESINFDKRKTELNQFFNDWKGCLDQIDDVMIVGFKIP